MRDLNYQLKQICKHSHEGSFETRVGRERQLSAIANQLHDLGFRQLRATSLKHKHVQILVDLWLKQDLSPGTIKNRMNCLGHRNGDITTHYSAPELEELLAAANKVCEEKSGKSPALVMLKQKTASR